MLAGGHVLVEDVPGSGKTTLARAVAACLGGDFRRIQGTADLLPADITGSGVWEPDRRAFAFVPGPVFGHVVLVDELNRTPPRTQSAFLEAMDEGAVTVDGVRHPLPGAVRRARHAEPARAVRHLPAARGAAGPVRRHALAGRQRPAPPSDASCASSSSAPSVEALRAVTTPAELVDVRAEVRRTHVADAVLDHAVRVVEATRAHPDVVLGASTRAALTLVHCAQARALLGGRGHVSPDDVKALAPAVLGHRLVLRDGSSGLERGQRVVHELLASVPVPLAT